MVTKKRKITFFDVHGSERGFFRRALKNLYGVEVGFTELPLDETTVKDFPDTTVASVFITSKVDNAVMSKLPGLELVATRSTGYEHIDLGTAKEHHILVSNVPEYGQSTVAEYTFMLILALCRRLVPALEQVESGLIGHEDLTGTDLNGKTLGLVGLGKIGLRTAAIANGFGMKVIAHDPHTEESGGVEKVAFTELLKTSDVISLHLPLNKQTKHMIDAAAIAVMKPGVILINTARGSLIKTKDLVDGLYSGHVAAAGLDVIEGEHLLRFDEEISLLHPDAEVKDLRLNAEHQVLLRMPNVIITPHNAFNSREALQRIRNETVENIKSYLMHSPRNVVKP